MTMVNLTSDIIDEVLAANDIVLTGEVDKFQAVSSRQSTVSGRTSS